MPSPNAAADSLARRQSPNDPITQWLDHKMALSHFNALVLFSFLVSVVFGIIAKDTPLDRLVYGAKSFGLFVGIAVLLGWIMYFLPL
jgi:hypothetical protein